MDELTESVIRIVIPLMIYYTVLILNCCRSMHLDANRMK
jgi:hypothetical protein